MSQLVRSYVYDWVRIALPIFLLLGFVASLVLRVVVGGLDVSQSAGAGLLFAACLLLLALAGGVQVRLNLRVWAIGTAGGVFLCLPALLVRLGSGASHLPTGNYLMWSVVVAIVAVAEEVFLRGVLYDTVARISHPVVAIVGAAVVFAGLHVPLYGWHVVPLDFAVGLYLGALRYASGSFVAPAAAHTLADLAAWWLR